MSLKLYEIDEAILQLSNEIELYAEENDGLIPEDVDAKLEAMLLERDKKISHVSRWLKSLNAEFDAVDAESKRLKSRCDSIQNRIDGVKRFLSHAVGEGNKFKDGVVSIYWKKSKSVNVVDATYLPKEYQKITVEPNKTDIKKDIELGLFFESDNVKIETKNSIVVR